MYPDGTTRPISWDRAVLSGRAGDTLTLALDDNAYRLQLQIQSSGFPHSAVHPGTGGNPWLVAADPDDARRPPVPGRHPRQVASAG
ncbi:hypothetical protein ABZ464_26190 [Streptomyces sp. NPDC005820]|uniref:hypothetical protein n=1 Tax=Streptomyces sp. NPDC005820 TaxID=3157069 RepID=UPI0033D6B4BF